MNDDQSYISRFLEVFETKPDLFEEVGAVEDLANLNQTISRMVDESDDKVADAIGTWCKKYPKIREQVNLVLKKLQPKATKTEGQNERLSNRYPELPENLKKRLPKS